MPVSGILPDSASLQLDGRIFLKSGQNWSRDRLSPDRRWIVLQSWQGRAGSGGDGLGYWPSWDDILGYKGRAFWDFYNADTGSKVLTIKGRYNTSNPGGSMQHSFWLTERYFIVPLDEQRQQCLVCEFGGKATAKQ
jgi:hypothetical protein